MEIRELWKREEVFAQQWDTISRVSGLIPNAAARLVCVRVCNYANVHGARQARIHTSRAAMIFGSLIKS